MLCTWVWDHVKEFDNEGARLAVKGTAEGEGGWRGLRDVGWRVGRGVSWRVGRVG